MANLSLAIAIFAGVNIGVVGCLATRNICDASENH